MSESFKGHDCNSKDALFKLSVTITLLYSTFIRRFYGEYKHNRTQCNFLRRVYTVLYTIEDTKTVDVRVQVSEFLAINLAMQYTFSLQASAATGGRRFHVAYG